MNDAAARPTSDLERHIGELTVLGYTIIPELIDSRLLADLRAAFDAYLDDGIASPERSTWLKATGKNRYSAFVRLEGPFADPALVANPRVLEVVARIFGQEPKCTYYGSDTALPGSEYQPVHADADPLFPELPIALPPSAFVLDIPLVDFTADNGPLEIWPSGTHLVPVAPRMGVVGKAAEFFYLPGPGDALSGTLPSTRVLMPAGSGLLRDLRMWHRGTPNNSAHRRAMLAISYGRPWEQATILPIAPAEFERLPDTVRRVFRALGPVVH